MKRIKYLLSLLWSDTKYNASLVNGFGFINVEIFHDSIFYFECLTLLCELPDVENHHGFSVICIDLHRRYWFLEIFGFVVLGNRD